MFRNLFITLLLLTSCATASFSQVQEWEWNYLHRLESNRSPAADRFYKTVSNLSDPIALALPASCITIGIIQKDAALKQKGLYMAGSFAANAVITHTLKAVINRKRPVEKDPSFTTVVSAGSRSFPSGHTSEAFAMATAVTLSFPKWYVAVPAYSFASLVGYSRMYLGVHYPSDVIAGAIVGSSSAWLSFKLQQKLLQRRQLRKSKTAKATYLR